jgi:hypothetical protein
MLQVRDPGLNEATRLHLEQQQAAINAHATHQARKGEMEMRWNSKKNGEGIAAFEEILGKLRSMAVAEKYCNYCEQNLIMPSTIEHIRPKGSFPHHAFAWKNMMAVCENCNMGFKKAQMWVFWPEGTSTLWNVGYSEPKSEDLVFIDLRSDSEDPMDLMELDFNDFQFKLRASYAIGSREFHRVEKTIKILHLYEDDYASIRAIAYEDFVSRLDDYCNVAAANSFEELRIAIKLPRIDSTRAFEEEKQRILAHIRSNTLARNHQTVLREMIRQSDGLTNEIQQLIITAKVAEWA